MKFYKMKLWGNNYHYIKTLKFKSPISIEDLDKYFLEYEDLYLIDCYNRKGLFIYALYKDKTFALRIYNKKKEKVYLKWYNGEIEYPEGKGKYDEYMREKKKNKLKRILKWE